MIDIILIATIVTLAVIVFNVQTRRELKARREIERLERLRRLREEGGDSRTIDLIGEEAYRDMTSRIDRILRRHDRQPCVTLPLTCGPDSRDGASQLHHLLPGCPVAIVPCVEAGLECFDAYSNGSRIGRYALLEAETLRDILKTNHIRGAYVAEQNCYEIEDSHEMRVIVFYEPRVTGDRIGCTQSPHRPAGHTDTAVMDICQN